MAWTNHGSRRATIRRLMKVALFASVCASFTSMAGPLDSVPVGRWYQFPSSRMDAVQPSPLPPGYIQAVMVAWSGGVYDTDRERLVVWGGGHGDYGGNEVYAFGPLTSDTPRWERLTNPTNPPANNAIRASDGRPVSRHTYNLLTYLPAPHNKMMSCAVGSQYSNGFAAGGVDFYDFTVNGMTGQPWSAGPTAPSNAYAYDSYCIYNPSTNSVFYQDVGSNSARLQEYSLTTRTWTSHVTYDPSSRPTPAVDTKRNLIVTTGYNHGLQVYDPANPRALPIRVASTGPKNIEGASAPGFAYDSANDQFVGWNGGTALYTLKAPADPKTGTWVWSQLSLDGGNAVTPTQPAGVRISGYIIGTFGRFRYVPSQKGVIVVNSTDESVYFFKLGGGSTSTAPAATINFAASPTSVAAQGTSTLTWSTTNAASCSAAGAWTGAKATSGSEARGPLSANSTFTMTCANSAGATTSRSVTVSVAAATPAPTVDVNANPASVPTGGATSLSWTTSNATSCTAGGGWSGSKATSGSENIAAVNQQTTYTLSCTGPGGTQSDSATVAVTAPTPAPVVTFGSSSSSVTSGSNVTLNWSATNATGCTASGAWAGTKAASGSQSVGPLSAASTFGLSCSGSGGSNSKSVTVNVTSTPPATGGSGPLASATAGRWVQFANSRMDAVAPSPLPAGYIAAVMLAWNGGVYDTDRERLVIWGGGGSDYAGNEVYAFGPLTSDSPRWERLTDPSTPVANNVVRGADGRPVSRHTYSLLTYLPAPHNKMMSCSVGGQYSNGYGVGAVDFYDFTINGKTGQPWSAGPTAPSNAYPYNSYCIYNPGTNSVFYQDNGSNGASLQEFKLSTQTWTNHVQYNPGSEPTAAVDTKRNLIVTTGQYHGVQIYDPASPRTLPIRVATNGPKLVEDGRFPGFIYDPVNDQFIGWNGGSAIYALKPPADVRTGTWVWSQLALDSGNTITPTAPAGVRHVGYVLGTYGRFRYVPSLHGAVLVNATDESVYFFKLPGGAASTPPPAPTVNLAASPTSVASQGSSTLTWSTSNAASCTASGAWSGTKAISGSEVRGPLSANSTFTLTCANSAGVTASRSVTVTVAAPTAPAPTLTRTPNGLITVVVGSTVTYTWSSTNATSCVASGNWTGNKPLSGTETVGPINANSNYRLICSGPGGEAEVRSVVQVVQRPTVTLSATPTTITAGGSTAVSWSSTNATSCVASGAWSGSKAVSGSESVTLNQSGALNLTCSNAAASAQGSVNITVNTPTTPPPAASAVLVNDGPATPEQISIFIPTSLPLTATASVRYRRVGASAWTVGHALHRIRPDFSDTPAPAGGFAWVITDLTPGTAYDVEATLVNGTASTVHAGVITTRALPAAAGAANKVIAAGSTAAQIQTVFNNANPGDVIQFANGTYTVSDLQLNRSGTAASPIYIRGESRNGTILRDTSGAVVRLLAASNIVFENFTLEGSKVDSGTNASSVGISFYDGTSPTQANVTVRNMTFNGFDQGVIGSSEIRQILVYDNVFRGNNQWGQDLYAYGAGGAPGTGDGVLDLEQNIFWNDDGIRLPGFGHAVFNNTFTGFGDTLAVCSHAGGSATAACATSHFYRNDIRMTGDDAIEVDYGIRNITFYDNRVHNSATFISLDPVFGGPFIASRNISINTTRGPFKFNSPNSGHFIYSNTIVRTTGTFGVAGQMSAEAGWYQANNGPQRGFGYQNNLFIYRGNGTQTIRLDNPGYSNLDFSHNSWYPNGIFQWPENNYSNLATAFSSLPATTPVFSTFTKRHQNDNISELDPFATDVVLGNSYRTQVTTLYTPVLSPGSAPTNNGVVIPNVTDGFSGTAPDRGAIITGRPLPQWGDRSSVQ